MRIARRAVSEDVRMPADHLARDRLNHVAERERALLLGKPRVIDDLEQQVAKLVDTLAAGSGRISEVLAATAVGLNTIRLRGALAQMQQLLNVEGYAVLGTDATSRAVTLDIALVKEQFEIR